MLLYKNTIIHRTQDPQPPPPPLCPVHSALNKADVVVQYVIHS